ncbi:hypothetical protein AbraIFM66951_007968 [Aspergillus brasiliensis]|uniref:F-box domain-containing protein n=1 Tax=Aspergillus brasiliensis TaxID=319629 RepID=A0A9W5YRN3_9EURO|nr:hypothetical protein AbraCBS73388_008474 [Aspergillus brasiliensis]GKZ45351.1 hypothetical protein AbraIFM66951_007968 [Aspergillus brasiliensis]
MLKVISDQTMCKPSRLSTLPLEMVERICHELATEDLAALRGTCRAAHHLTNRCFAQRYTEYYTDFSARSLNHLHALAENPLIRGYIQHLVILSPEPRLGQNMDWHWTAAGHLRCPLDMPLIRRLRDDLTQKLVNCRSFILSPILSEPEAKADLHASPSFNPDDVACILLDVIADASLPVKLFWYGKGMNYTSKVMDIARLPKSLYSNAAFRAGWQSLENLHLEQELTPQNYTFVMDMILSATSLRKLHLGLGYTDLSVEFFSQLSTSIATLHHLERISIWGTSMHTEDLIRLLSGSRTTLKKLSLRSVTGLTPEWLAYLCQHHDSFPCLTTLDLSMIHGPAGMLCFTSVQNLPPEQKNMFELERCLSEDVPDTAGKASDIVGIAYSGSDIETALDVLLQVCSESAGLH